MKQQRYAIGEHEFGTLEELAHWMAEHAYADRAVRAVRDLSQEEQAAFDKALAEQVAKTRKRRANRERIRRLHKELQDLRADRSVLHAAGPRETESSQRSRRSRAN